MGWKRVFAVLALACGAALAQSDGNTRAEALVKEAIAFARKQGKEKLLEATNLPSGQFHIKKGDDLYLFIYNLQGLCLAHGAKIQLVGLSRYDAKDPDGKYYVREFIHIAKTKGSGWTSYRFPDPKNGKVETKTTFAAIHDDLIVCAGAYKE
jgi:cytochrome c